MDLMTIAKILFIVIAAILTLIALVISIMILIGKLSLNDLEKQLREMEAQLEKGGTSQDLVKDMLKKKLSSPDFWIQAGLWIATMGKSNLLRWIPFLKK